MSKANKGRLSDSLIKAKEWSLKNLVGKKVFHKDINSEILFNADGISHAIYIIVRENKNGKFYYDHGIIKEKP